MGSGAVRLVTSQLLVAVFLLFPLFVFLSFLVFCWLRHATFNMRPLQFLVINPFPISKWH